MLTADSSQENGSLSLKALFKGSSSKETISELWREELKREKGLSKKRIVRRAKKEDGRTGSLSKAFSLRIRLCSLMNLDRHILLIIENYESMFTAGVEQSGRSPRSRSQGFRFEDGWNSWYLVGYNTQDTRRPFGVCGFKSHLRRSASHLFGANFLLFKHKQGRISQL